MDSLRIIHVNADINKHCFKYAQAHMLMPPCSLFTQEFQTTDLKPKNCNDFHTLFHGTLQCHFRFNSSVRWWHCQYLYIRELGYTLHTPATRCIDPLSSFLYFVPVHHVTTLNTERELCLPKKRAILQQLRTRLLMCIAPTSVVSSFVFTCNSFSDLSSF